MVVKCFRVYAYLYLHYLNCSLNLDIILWSIGGIPHGMYFCLPPHPFFNKWSNRDSEKLNNLPEVSQVGLTKWNLLISNSNHSQHLHSLTMCRTTLCRTLFQVLDRLTHLWLINSKPRILPTIVHWVKRKLTVLFSQNVYLFNIFCFHCNRSK